MKEKLYWKYILIEIKTHTCIGQGYTKDLSSDKNILGHYYWFIQT